VTPLCNWFAESAINLDSNEQH